MAAVVPFPLLLSLLEPFYPQVGPQGGRPPYPHQVMLRIHLMQNCYSLSAAARGNELIDVVCRRRFAAIDLVTSGIPEPRRSWPAATCWSSTCGERRSHCGKRALERGRSDVGEGTVVDATIITLPPPPGIARGRGSLS